MWLSAAEACLALHLIICSATALTSASVSGPVLLSSELNSLDCKGVCVGMWEWMQQGCNSEKWPDALH